MGQHRMVRWWQGHGWMKWAGLVGVMGCLVAGVTLGVLDSGGGSGRERVSVVERTSVVRSPGQTIVSFVTPEAEVSEVVGGTTTVVASGSGAGKTVTVGPSGSGVRVTATARVTVTALVAGPTVTQVSTSYVAVQTVTERVTCWISFPVLTGCVN